MLSDVPMRRCSAATEVLTDLACLGVALIDAVPSPRELIALAGAIGTVIPHRDSRPDGVTAIEDRGARGPGLAGFSRSGLAPHTDRSGVATPPGLLLTLCGREPSTGGDSVLVDGQAVYDDLANTNPVALEALSTPRSVLFGRADGYLGSVFTENPDGVVAIRLRLDRLARFSPSAWPHIPALSRTIQRHAITLPLSAGAGYVVNNTRWLHGRLAFDGPRLVYRVTANPLPGHELAGFRPTHAVTADKSNPAEDMAL